MTQCFIVLYFIVVQLLQMTDSTYFFAILIKKFEKIRIYDRLDLLFRNCKIRDIKLTNWRDILAYEPVGNLSLQTSGTF